MDPQKVVSDTRVSDEAHMSLSDGAEKDDNELVVSKYRGTEADKRDMQALGKKQVLRVRITEEYDFHTRYKIAEDTGSATFDF